MSWKARDERTIAVENASYALGYKIVDFAVLVDVMFRALRYDSASWDLLAIVIVSGLFVTLYQVRYKILGPTWAKATALVTFLGAVVAAGAAILIAALSGR